MQRRMNTDDRPLIIDTTMVDASSKIDSLQHVPGHSGEALQCAILPPASGNATRRARATRPGHAFRCHRRTLSLCATHCSLANLPRPLSVAQLLARRQETAKGRAPRSRLPRSSRPDCPLQPRSHAMDPVPCLHVPRAPGATQALACRQDRAQFFGRNPDPSKDPQFNANYSSLVGIPFALTHNVRPTFVHIFH